LPSPEVAKKIFPNIPTFHFDVTRWDPRFFE
jgi:hypothetical protein